MKLKQIISIVALSATMSAGSVLPAFARDGILTADYSDSSINLRAAADPNSRSLGYGLVGDRVKILDERVGADNYGWYRVRFYKSNAEGWIQGRFVRADNPESGEIKFETNDYAVRIYPQEGRMFLNLFDKRSKTTQFALPVSMTRSADGTSYLHSGNPKVDVFVHGTGGRTLLVNNSAPQRGY